MAQEQGSGCFKAFLIMCVLNVLVLGALGAGGYLLWKKSGAPTWATIQEFAEENGGGSFAGSLASGDDRESPAGASSGSPAASRPIVATAPIQGNLANYQTYTARKDVMTLVNYYSDT